MKSPDASKAIYEHQEATRGLTFEQYLDMLRRGEPLPDPIDYSLMNFV